MSALDKEKACAMSEEWGIPFFLSMLLDIRNINKKDEVESFLSKSIVIDDPMEIKDMDKAAKRVNNAIDNFEKICVYGDYDADGIASTVLLYSYLESMGADVMYYIPQREEGYGLNCEAIDKLNEYNVSLIITVDNGIVAVDEVDYAKKLGIDVVITDHHQPREQLPNAVAVVDPHQNDCQSRFKLLAGVGVAFKLVMALEGEERNLDSLFENYSDLVAIGTIADVVLLRDENRCFVKEGLKYITNTDKPGIKSLLKESGIYGRSISSTNVAFTLVPRINASGRMGMPQRAVQLLLSENNEESDSISASLTDANKQRQKTEHEILKEVEELFAKEPQRLYQNILIVWGENWHTGVIGIVASKIVEKYGKPALVISSSEGMAKGSGRSIEGFSLNDAICANPEYLTKFGGHPMAAGINLESKNIEAFKQAMELYANKFSDMPFPSLKIDCKLNPSKLSIDLIEQVEEFEPFGVGNSKPVFALCNMTLKKITPVGGGKHLRLTLSRDENTLTAMRFSVTKKQFPYNVGDILDLAVNVDINEYYNEKSISVIIIDCKLSNLDTENFLIQRRIFEKLKRNEEIDKISAESLMPSRDEFAIVYRYLRKNNGMNFGIDILYHRLDKKLEFGKILVIIDIMKELNLIEVSIDGDNYNISVNQSPNKVNLESSLLLNKIKQWRY